MNSKRILTIFILFALLMATSNAAFASSDIDDTDLDLDNNEFELDEFDNQDDLNEENLDDIGDDLDDNDEELDDDSDENLDDNSDDTDEDSDDEDLDDDSDDELDDTDEDLDDDSDDELDDTDEDLDDDSDDELDDSDEELDDDSDETDEELDDEYSDEELDDDYWDDFKWDTVEEWYENVDGKMVHIYKTTAFYKGKTYMASSCSYVPNETSDNKTCYEDNETNYPGKCDVMISAYGADSSKPDSQSDFTDLKSVSKSIDLSVSNDADSKNTSTDTTEYTSIPQMEYDLGILGLLLVLIMSVIFII